MNRKARDKDVGGTVTATATLPGYRLFASGPPSRLAGIRVFDVGQGDCIGLLDGQDNVVAYIDYGGCIQHPETHVPSWKTSKVLDVGPSGARLTIVLTHWDKDHYWSSTKNSDAKDCHWLVPRQHVSPTAARHAATLSNASCWPESLGQACHRFAAGGDHEVEIRKCRAFRPAGKTEDRNSSGLAVTLIALDAQGNDEAQMMLPGDCSFDRIPSLPAVPIVALVAYHHGSHNHWRSPQTEDAIDDRAAGAEMVYSYGDPNPYRHPDRASYAPDWDAVAHTTPNLRASSVEYVDLGW